VPTEDWSKLSEDQVTDLLEQTLATLCAGLEAQGLDPDYISGALFNQFTQRLCETNDREQYDLILEMALESQWDDITVH